MKPFGLWVTSRKTQGSPVFLISVVDGAGDDVARGERCRAGRSCCMKSSPSALTRTPPSPRTASETRKERPPAGARGCRSRSGGTGRTPCWRWWRRPARPSPRRRRWRSRGWWCRGRPCRSRRWRGRRGRSGTLDLAGVRVEDVGAEHAVLGDVPSLPVVMRSMAK